LYLYSKAAPGEIRALSPDAKVIVLLRDPVEMVCSLHAHNLLLNHEDLPDLISFLGLEPGGRPDFKAVNRRSRWRSPRAGRLLLRGLRRGSLVAQKLPTRALRTSALALVGLLSIVPMRLNLAPARPSAPAPELLAGLRDEFREDVGHLAEILGRDLSSWLAPV
jgi:hypothetical protein